MASASTKYLDCDPGKWLEEQFSAIRKKIGWLVELVNVVHAEVSALVKWLKVCYIVVISGVINRPMFH